MSKKLSKTTKFKQKMQKKEFGLKKANAKREFKSKKAANRSAQTLALEKEASKVARSSQWANVAMESAKKDNSYRDDALRYYNAQVSNTDAAMPGTTQDGGTGDTTSDNRKS